MDKSILYSYMAGLIDGEGSIRFQVLKKTGWRTMYSGCIRIGMTVKEPIELFSNEFGGKIGVEKRENGYKTMYRWSISGNKKIIPILNILLPYLVVKKRQAELIIDFCKNKKTFSGSKTPDMEYKKRENFYKRMLILNH